MESNKPYHVISGYRSPKTNAYLHGHTSGVAKNSYHTLGKAIDLFIEGHRPAALKKAAHALHFGGVGGYSAFVHLDTGRPRTWGI
jgi:uncharacterized protein YcbK (DUF882 family)